MSCVLVPNRRARALRHSGSERLERALELQGVRVRCGMGCGVLVVLVLWLTAGVATAIEVSGTVLVDGQVRTALVVGHTESGRLVQVPSDAERVAEALRDIGFSTHVTIDPTVDDLPGLLAGLDAPGSDMAMVYYLGGLHAGGLRIALTPTTPLGATGEPVQTLVDTVSTARLVGLVVLDASWNTPPVTPDEFARMAALVGVGSRDAIVLAALARTAVDAADPSPLARSWRFGTDRAAVTLAGVVDALGRRLRFTTNDQVTLAQAGTPGALDMVMLPARDVDAVTATERMFWATIQSSQDAADFQDYLAAYPNGAFAEAARTRLNALLR